jgi:hypothetical protein
MTKPTIHLNGTSAESLLEQYRAAMDALQDAQSALAGTQPNGRDYYPAGPEAMDAALKEHWDRMTRLKEVRDQITELAEYCFEELEKRKARK